jgi:ABC-type transport system involved in multi-copper enzyme maturation permease subunit
MAILLIAEHDNSSLSDQTAKDKRPSPEALLQEASREMRGHLKVFLGAAPGVGKTYEMLLASPLRPGAIVIGKLFAALAHLALLIFTSLPIVMLCLPLGGVSLYEVLAGYLILMLSVATFGMITVACSGFFQRSASSLVVSYLLILPIALSGAMFWQLMEDYASFRLWILLITVPVASFVTISLLFFVTAERLLYPRDLGSEGKEVVDLDQEAEQAIGLVIQRDQFPDRLFAPPKRTQLLDDRANPVYEKELHSEIFAQGTLMLRVVIQVSMILAIIPMGFYLYWFPHLAPLYIAYVLIFNIMVGPVFSAGSITSERERETLDLLLTTEISPWQILSAKLMAGSGFRRRNVRRSPARDPRTHPALRQLHSARSPIPDSRPCALAGPSPTPRGAITSSSFDVGAYAHRASPHPGQLSHYSCVTSWDLKPWLTGQTGNADAM